MRLGGKGVLLITGRPSNARRFGLADAGSVDGCGNCPALEIRRHFRKRSVVINLTLPARHARPGAADRRQFTVLRRFQLEWDAAHKSNVFWKLSSRLMTFDDANDFPRCNDAETFPKAVGFFAMIFRAQHARDNRHFEPGGTSFPMSSPAATVRPRSTQTMLDLRSRSVRGNADYTMSFSSAASINGCKSLDCRGQDDSVHAASTSS